MCARKRKTARTMSIDKQKKMLCDELSFAGAEAYKQLRTNIIFSLPRDKDSVVIGMTSSQMGDGKSTTSINLAYSLAQSGKKVLLIEGDMRLPYMAKRLELKETPGLSDYLAGESELSEVIQPTNVSASFDAMSAGSIPPNPSELLSGAPMKQLLQGLHGHYDYILLDMPPLNAVTDAASLADVIDGYVLVVRQEQTSMRAVDDAMRALKIVNGKVLGFVVNDVRNHEHGYGYGNSYYGEYA